MWLLLKRGAALTASTLQRTDLCKSLAASDAERAIILVQALTDPTCHMEQNRHSTKLRASEAFRWAITHPAERAAEGICGPGWSGPFHLYCFTWDLRCIQDTATDMPGISLILLCWLKLTYALWVLALTFTEHTPGITCGKWWGHTIIEECTTLKVLQGFVCLFVFILSKIILPMKILWARATGKCWTHKNSVVTKGIILQVYSKTTCSQW